MLSRIGSANHCLVLVGTAARMWISSLDESISNRSGKREGNQSYRLTVILFKKCY